jgi:hypothetical protein
MDILSEVAEAMQSVLSTKALIIALESDFIKRERKLNGSNFVQTLVFGWLANPSSSLEELTQTAAALGVSISPQGLDQRFTKEAASFLHQVLDEAVSTIISTNPAAIPLLRRFNGVYIQDSSIIRLPDELCEIWTGCGGSSPQNTSSSVKLQIRWDFSAGGITGPILQSGRENDKSCSLMNEPLPAQALWIALRRSRALFFADLGYFSLTLLADFSADDTYWLTRLKSNCILYDKEGKRWELVDFLNAQRADEIDQTILLGSDKRLECRLIAARLPEKIANERRRKIRALAREKGKTPSKRQLALADWIIYATNVPSEMLNFKEALVLARVRWQIELLFRLWKKHGKIDSWRTEKPWRILCELYAKLLTMIVQHWVFLVSCWQYANRSLQKAAQTVQKHATHLAVAFASGCIERLCEALKIIKRCLSKGCRINKRKTKPATYQLLLETRIE